MYIFASPEPGSFIMTIIRVSMFKIPKEEDIDFLLSKYKTLRSEARKVSTSREQA